MKTKESAKAKIGVVYVTSGWFRDVGLQDGRSDTTERVNHIADKITANLRKICDPIYAQVIFSEQEAENAGKQLKHTEIDGILLAPLMWCEDQIVRACIKYLRGVPIILWTFSPTSTLPEYLEFHTMLQGSGAVCALQLSGMLKREGHPYYPVVGSLEDQSVFSRIRSIAAGLMVKRCLSTIRVGVLPFPCSQMSTTYVDEFGLRARYGIELRYIELERVKATAADVGDKELITFRNECLPAAHQIQVDDRNLEQGIRFAMALEKIIEGEGLTVLAMNDVIEEMHTSFGMRPSLTNPRIGEMGAFVSMEADIAAGIGMYVLAQLTGELPFYTEVFGVDYEKNALLLGHAGYHDWKNADSDVPVQVIPDVEYQNSDPYTGCVTFFKYHSGLVTVINSVWDGARLKWFGFQGTSLAGPNKMAGNCHLFCRVDVNINALLADAVQDGVSQHWIVVPGHVLAELEVACNALDIGIRAKT